jgi:hypothetical protein
MPSDTAPSASRLFDDEAWQAVDDPTEVRRATLSDDGRYRYDLERWWGPVGRPARGVLWIMCNPSTADAERDDFTIRRCRVHSRRWGYDGLVAVNLYAYRATHPSELVTPDDPVGRRNTPTVMRWLRDERIEVVVAAWGGTWKQSGHPSGRHNMLRLARLAGRDLMCLGQTSHGDPLHPAARQRMAPKPVPYLGGRA